MNDYQSIAKAIAWCAVSGTKIMDIEQSQYSRSHKTWPNVWDFKRAVERLGLKFSWGNYSHGKS